MNDYKIKIFLVIPSLKAGGAERVLSYLAQKLDAKLFKITLIVIGYERDGVFDIKDSDIIFLNKKRVLHAFIPLFNIYLRRKPDIVFSAISHLNIMTGLLAVFFPRIIFIGREATVRSAASAYNSVSKNNFLGKFISKIGYKNLHKIVCQSHDMANDMIVNFGIPAAKIVVINNPIPEDLKLKQHPVLFSKEFSLITIGRLVTIKGHSRILNALSKLDLPFNYTIIGDGPEKNKIMEHARDLGIFENITHIPFTKKVFKYLADSHLFLQGSYVEGFPNALLESCASGTPVIAFMAPGGTKEIIEEGINGYMVKDSDEFIARIIEVLQSINGWDPERVSNTVYEKFSSEKIINCYENLFIDLFKNSKFRNKMKKLN